jgi:hypothetical protein
VRWWLSQESLGTGGRDDIRTVSKSLQGIKDPLPKALEKTLPSHSFLYYFPLKLRGVVAQDGTKPSSSMGGPCSVLDSFYLFTWRNQRKRTFGGRNGVWSLANSQILGLSNCYPSHPLGSRRQNLSGAILVYSVLTHAPNLSAYFQFQGISLENDFFEHS